MMESSQDGMYEFRTHARLHRLFQLRRLGHDLNRANPLAYPFQGGYSVIKMVGLEGNSKPRLYVDRG